MVPLCDAEFLALGYWNFSGGWSLELGVSRRRPRMPFCSQGVISSARRFAKAEVRGANPRESASFSVPVPQQPHERFCKPLFVGASPTRGPSLNQERGVIAASLPVKETVRVQLPAS